MISFHNISIFLYRIMILSFVSNESLFSEFLATDFFKMPIPTIRTNFNSYPPIDYIFQIFCQILVGYFHINFSKILPEKRMRVCDWYLPSHLGNIYPAQLYSTSLALYKAGYLYTIFCVYFPLSLRPLLRLSVYFHLFFLFFFALHC
jgi:hypothetical protein